jgi:pSer/pThr/pTyr-binding forkhead associated (FHA) protein
MRQFRISYDNGEIACLSLRSERLILGRSKAADLSCPKDFALSRNHCVLEREGDDWTVEDLGSRNGTFIKGVRLARKARLRPGDVVVAGHLVLTYLDPTAPVAEVAEDAELGLVQDDRHDTVIEGGDGDEGNPRRGPEAPVRDLQPVGFAWLHIVSRGRHYGNRYNVAKDFTIGRDLDSQLILNDPSVSRHHARILLENKRYYLYNTGANGTLLNGAKIRDRAELRDRNEIQIAGTVLQFIQPVSKDEMTTPGKRRLRDFEQVWNQLSAAARLGAPEEFTQAAETLIRGVLAEPLGLKLETPIPYHAGIAGYMVQAPALRIRRTHFPILVVAYSEEGQDLRQALAVQLAQAKAADYFVVFIVVPARDFVVDEAMELRRQVVDRAARNDLIVLDQEHLAELVGVGTQERLLTIVMQQGVDLSVLSPYILAGAVSDQMFFGREKEIKTIKTVGQGVSFAVTGGRRIGKSSILHKLTTLMNQEPELYWAKQMSWEHIEDYAGFFGTLRDELRVKGTGSDPDEFRKLATAKKRELGNREMVFLFDEVDALLRYDTGEGRPGRLCSVFRYLMDHRVCRFVFSGSRTLFQNQRNAGSPFYNFCREMILEPLDRESVADVVLKPLRQLGIELEDEGALVNGIVVATSCHPNLAQWCCGRLLNTIGTHRITMADLEAVLESREFCGRYVETAWGEAQPLEKVISMVMAGPAFELEELLKALKERGIGNSLEIQSALDILQLYSLIERTDRGFRFRLTEFPRMVRRYEKLEFQLRIELERMKS